MPWPPRLLNSPPLLPLSLLSLLLVALSPNSLLLPCSSASAISYADGQPEYPSLPEVTSDRDALARIFLQGLLEKEGKSRNPSGLSFEAEPNDWTGDEFSLKRSRGSDPNAHHRISLKDTPSQLRYGDDRGGSEDGLDDQDDDLAMLEPHVEKERVIEELLARGHPYANLRGNGILKPKDLTDDDENTRLNLLMRLIEASQSDPSVSFSYYGNRYKPSHQSRAGEGVWPGGSSSSTFKNQRNPFGHSLNKRNPFGINARGFHDDVFYRDFGSFNPMKRTARSTGYEEGKDLHGKPEKSHDAEGNYTESAINEGDKIMGTKEGKDSAPNRFKRSTETKPKDGESSKVDADQTNRAAVKREERAADFVAKRRPEMDSSGFHGDTFNSGFGDFWTMKRNSGHVYGRIPHLRSFVKRRPEMDSSGFHGDTFSSGFGDFYTMKRAPDGSPPWDTLREGKRRPEMDSSGFHGDTFNGGFGDFWTMKRGYGSSSPYDNRHDKRRPEMDSSGFHGDTFNGGFGDFWTMKRAAMAHPLVGSLDKRRPEMDSSGFHGDTFNGGFGDFWTMKRDGRPWGDGNFHSFGGRAEMEGGDDKGRAEGVATTVGKRRPEMDSSGFHGDTFNGGFGDFWTMKRNYLTPLSRMRRDLGREEKRRPEMDASGFHGDTFSNGFGDFWTLKRAGAHPLKWPMGRMEIKRRPEMDSSGFHGDTFNGGFGDFWTMKRNHAISHPSHFRGADKRRPEMDSSGFHGDTFNSGFGDFWTMKRSRGLEDPEDRVEEIALLHPSKRKPEMDSSGFHGDTFNGGFGDFWTMKRGNGADMEEGFARGVAEDGKEMFSPDSHDGVEPSVDKVGKTSDESGKEASPNEGKTDASKQDNTKN